MSIEVIEGDRVREGNVLAYLRHPDLVRLQTDYLSSWNQLQFLELELDRQQKLYDENIGSGKEFQKTRADFNSMVGMVKGYEAQLKMLRLDLDRIKQTELYERIPVTSSIDGYTSLAKVITGQYVEPQMEMFDVVNFDHIHTDLMVFEKDDIHRVKKRSESQIYI